MDEDLPAPGHLVVDERITFNTEYSAEFFREFLLLLFVGLRVADAAVKDSSVLSDLKHKVPLLRPSVVAPVAHTDLGEVESSDDITYAAGHVIVVGKRYVEASPGRAGRSGKERNLVFLCRNEPAVELAHRAPERLCYIKGAVWHDSDDVREGKADRFQTGYGLFALLA